MRRKTDNITRRQSEITAETRQSLLGQKGCVLWFTGLSGSGKSTLAYALEKKLIEQGHLAYVLDGDNIRHGLNGDLDFSEAGRNENIRRISEVAALFVDCGVICITAFISPFRSSRDSARNIIGTERYVEIFVDVPLDICEERDPKLLYKKARAGEIEQFTGIDSPYETPVDAVITLHADRDDVNTCVTQVIEFMRNRGLVSE